MTSSDREATQEEIPFVDLGRQHEPLATELRAAFDAVLRDGKFILGEPVERFEAAVRDFLGVKHAIGVSSGTDALLVSLFALGIGPGDELITTPYSFIATVECILRLGATPVFADIDARTFNLDPEEVSRVVTKRTRAIVPVHLFGAAQDMTRLTAIAEENGLHVVEDAAQALGATWQGRRAGTFGAFGCFSFFPTKNLGALGDAGLVVTNDDDRAEAVRSLRNHGVEARGVHAPGEHRRIGGNFRLDALQAALLAVKLPELAVWTDERRHRAAIYDQCFDAAGLEPKLLVRPVRDAGHVVHQYVITTPRRDELRRHLAAQGIGTATYYPTPLHLQPAVYAALPAEARTRRFSIAEHAARTSLALPIFTGITEPEVERVASAVVEFLRGLE